ncbi:unnamed protein product, partial [Didymodactylos carnosus]
NIECFVIPNLVQMEEEQEPTVYIPYSNLNFDRRTLYHNLFRFDLPRDKRFGNTRYGRDLDIHYPVINDRNLQQFKLVQPVPIY